MGGGPGWGSLEGHGCLVRAVDHPRVWEGKEAEAVGCAMEKVRNLPAVTEEAVAEGSLHDAGRGREMRSGRATVCWARTLLRPYPRNRGLYLRGCESEWASSVLLPGCPPPSSALPIPPGQTPCPCERCSPGDESPGAHNKGLVSLLVVEQVAGSGAQPPAVVRGTMALPNPKRITSLRHQPQRQAVDAPLQVRERRMPTQLRTVCWSYGWQKPMGASEGITVAAKT